MPQLAPHAGVNCFFRIDDSQHQHRTVASPEQPGIIFPAFPGSLDSCGDVTVFLL